MSFLRPSAAKQTTSTIGTGTLTLNVNSGDTRSFQTAMGSGPIKGRFTLRGQGYFEMFRGTFTAPSTLTRDEPIISSNANALVSIPAGTTDVYLLDYAQFVVDSFSGTTKTLANADASNTWIFTGSSASVLNLPAISSALPDFWGFVRNAGTANLTLTAQGSDVIDETGTQTAVFAAGDSAFVYLDTSNAKWRIVRGGSKVPTQQKLTSGSGATYTTPAGVRQLRIRMYGGGSGGGATGTVSVTGGGAGGDTSFNGVVAKGGGATATSGVGTPGAGGTGGTGTAIRIAGQAGFMAAATIFSSTEFFISGGAGGGPGGGITTVGTGGSAGAAGAANTGGGGAGASIAHGTPATVSATVYGPGGGQGENAEFIINSPAATYTYTIGAGGNGGTAGTGNAGGAGGSGLIIVDEIY
jgi:hypothetical protein